MIFRYSSHEFEQDNIPKCNICGNDLVVKLRKKYKPKRYEYYQILSCTNCELKTKDLKWKSLTTPMILMFSTGNIVIYQFS